MCCEPQGFSKFLVMFVDILGSKNRTDFKDTYHINKIFHEEFEKNQKNDVSHTAYFREIFTFSDCAYTFYGFKEGVSDELKDLGKLFTVALCNSELLFLRLLKERIIFRGGIYYGDAYVDHHRSMFFGEAVNQAYMLESEVAIHPRIVIDDYVAKTVLENIETVKHQTATNNPDLMDFLGAGIMPKMSFTGDGIVERDIDGKYIFNYLHFPENNISSSGIYMEGNEFIDELIQYCDEQIDKNNNYKIIDKYYYLLRFANSKLNSFNEIFSSELL